MIKPDSYLDIEHDLRHGPLIISESGCNTNTKAAPRKKKQDKVVLDGRRSSILKKDEATLYRSLFETLIPIPRQIGSCRNSETFGPQNEEASRIRLSLVETCSAVSDGKAQRSIVISKTDTC